MPSFPQIRAAVVFDLEFTAWEGSMAARWSRPGEFTELVQIGAVRLNADTFEELGAIDLLVRPRLNPVLSDYFVELTGIGNVEMAARGSTSWRPTRPSGSLRTVHRSWPSAATI
jgi:inhibitor of KinA sporulation pathway (predicted exonuclease)